MEKSPLNKEIRYLKGVGERRAASFARLGIYTVSDLLNHFPRGYEDRRRIVKIADVKEGESVCITARIASPVRTRNIRKGFSVSDFRVIDESGVMEISFFNQKYSVSTLKSGEEYTFFGKVSEGLRGYSMKNPVFEKTESFGDKTGSVLPIYPLTGGITANMMRGHVKAALAECAGCLEDVLPAEIRERNKLSHISYAMQKIHFPQSPEESELAAKRLVFEELFVMSLGLMRLRARRDRVETESFEKLDLKPFSDALSFELTGAQKRVLAEISADLGRDIPMNRIVQGDVGSGKTAVAAAGAYLAFINGFRTALMVPTEILAEQHYKSLKPLFEKLGMKSGLLTGSLKASEKRAVKEKIASGELDVVIGTHALISEDVAFSKLGLVIADEQHRFGVSQRAMLSAKGKNPHTLVMSATPIPRSLALIMYGDLDISVIDELPPGRLPVDTLIVGQNKREAAYQFIKEQIEKGNRAYIVCPLIEGDETEEKEELRSVEKFAQELSETVFRDASLEVIHGRQKTKDKEAAMRRFANGETQVLVSTTVIEVGVNVPEATVMAIENAERFGLSQLHQLRGRVGRGSEKAYCILFSNVPKNSTAAERLMALRKTNDGFLIAEEDLKLRGPGDFFGTRQHGLPELKIASLSCDARVLAVARREAEKILKEDPELEKEEHRLLSERIKEMFSEESGNAFN